jgi:Flp pilus assembly pilin Flp
MYDRGNEAANTSRRMKMIGTQALIFLMRAWRDRRGQDLIEYTLMAGFVAVAAGAIMPQVATSISTIFSSVASVMTAASTQS